MPTALGTGGGGGNGNDEAGTSATAEDASRRMRRRDRATSGGGALQRPATAVAPGKKTVKPMAPPNVPLELRPAAVAMASVE